MEAMMVEEEEAVPYTHPTPPTNREGEISVVAVALKKKQI